MSRKWIGGVKLSIPEGHYIWWSANKEFYIIYTFNS